jgi:hypothetical protein
MIACLDASTTMGAAWNIYPVPLLSTELLPCNDEIWEDPEPPLLDLPTPEEAPKASSFSLYVSVVTSELGKVRQALQEPYDLFNIVEQERWFEDCDRIYEELCMRRSNVLESPIASYGFRTDGSVRFNVNIVSANIAFDRLVLSCWAFLPTDSHGKCCYFSLSKTSLRRLDWCGARSLHTSM